MEFDDPVDTLTDTQIALEDSVYHGNPDIIDPATAATTEAGLDSALLRLDTYLRQAKGGQYVLRGGKDGNYPGEHAYQRQFSLGPDNYAQFTTVPHYDFMYGTLQSSYDISAEFNGGPNSMYLMVKNAIRAVARSSTANTANTLKPSGRMGRTVLVFSTSSA